jgi:DNA-directed RNA polymerase specialized sigma24 family protein
VNDRILILHECIATLDEEEIELLVLCYVDGWSYEQIGTALNLTVWGSQYEVDQASQASE